MQVPGGREGQGKMANCSTVDVDNATDCNWNGSRNNITVGHSDCLGCTGVHFGLMSVTSLLFLLLGTTGNITAFVLHIKHKPRTSTNVLLAALGIADTVALCSLMLFCLAYSLFGIDLDVQLGCKVFWFLTFGGMHMSGLTTAFVSIERALVSFLSQENRKPCIAYAELTAGVAFVSLFDGYLLGALNANPESTTLYDHCLTPELGNLVYINLDLGLMVGLVICVSITNIAIICKIRKLANKVNPHTGSVLAQAKWLAIQKKTTIVCVTISFTFLVSCVFSFVGQRTQFTEYNWFYQYLLQIPLFINHSVNFYLYSVAAKQFRQKLKSLFHFPLRVAVGGEPNTTVSRMVLPMGPLTPRRP